MWDSKYQHLHKKKTKIQVEFSCLDIRFPQPREHCPFLSCFPEFPYVVLPHLPKSVLISLISSSSVIVSSTINFTFGKISSHKFEYDLLFW